MVENWDFTGKIGVLLKNGDFVGFCQEIGENKESPGNLMIS